MEKKLELNVYRFCFYILCVVGCVLHLLTSDNSFINGLCNGLYYFLTFYLILTLLALGVVLIFRENLIDLYSKDYLSDFVKTDVETSYTIIMFLLIFSLFILNGFYTHAILLSLVKVLTWMIDRAIESVLTENDNDNDNDNKKHST